MIDLKDLRLVLPNEELLIDGYFYIKNESGTFEGAILHEWEHDRMEEWQISVYLCWFKKMVDEKRAFIRRNKPWQRFEYKRQ